MEVIRLSTETQDKPQTPAVLAIGFFDGVHLGHQRVIEEAKQIADDKALALAVMTFTPHPKEVLMKQPGAVEYLTTMEQKVAIFDDLGVDFLYVVEFTKELAKLKPKAFINQFIIDLNIKHLVSGFDFSYGHKGKGNVHTLVDDAEGHFSVTIVEKFTDQTEKVSSTRIRELLKDGRVDEAQYLLTRPLKTRGTVVHGHKRGRTIGYPTANLAVYESQALPKTGVYYVTAMINGQQVDGMANLGYNPTFEDSKEQIKLEVHFLDFTGDLYGKVIEVEWQQYVREELKFDGIDPLIAQIEQDEQTIRQIILKNKG